MIRTTSLSTLALAALLSGVAVAQNPVPAKPAHKASVAATAPDTTKKATTAVKAATDTTKKATAPKKKSHKTKTKPDSTTKKPPA